MLGKLVSRLIQPLPSRGYDYLFTPFAPKGASASVLHALYHQYADAYPDEPVPPQHQHYRALVQRFVGRDQEPRTDGLQRTRAIYVACFERSAAFAVVARQWRHEREFHAALIDARKQVIAALLPNVAAEAARRRHYAHWRDCMAAPVQLEGAMRLDLIKQMSPDDWHEIARTWNWDHGVVELDWITQQRDCDRATAVYILCAGRCGDVATGKPMPAAQAGFVRALAARLEGGFYPNADLALGLSMRTAAGFEAQLAAARATHESPWRLPEDLLSASGARPHAPSYTIVDGVVRYHYEHWLNRAAS